MGKFIQYQTLASLYDGPFDDVAGWPSAAMGDVVVTEEGRLIVIDGGHPKDAERLLSLLEKESGGKKPVVDLWIITHAHGDHFGAVRNICETPSLLSRVCIKKLVYWFPAEFANRAGKVGTLNEKGQMMEAASEASGAQIYRPSLDERIVLDDITLHFLFVPDDCSILNTGNGSPNLCSLIFTVEGKRKKVMITGDAYERNMQMVVWRYHKKLKCDYLQLPHHALCDTGNLKFYREVDAEGLFLPVSAAGYRAMHSDMYEGNQKREWNLWAESNAQVVYKAFEGNAEVEI